MRRFEQLQGGSDAVARTAARRDGEAESAALAELREALARSPREIPCKYFYDDRGSALFEEITRLPEYYPTRTERELLIAQATAIVRAAGGSALSEVVELGSGAASKTVALLDAALRLGGKPRYVAVDISAHALARTRELLSEARPEVPVEEVLADYTQELTLPPPPRPGPRLALFLGGTIGNHEDEDAIRLVARMRSHLAPGDLLLLGANLVTDPAVIHAAYNDSAGITAEFNRNVLRSVNALAGSAFDPADYDHYAPYVVDRRRIEMWLVARRAVDVDLGRLGGRLELERGEGIRTEISRRFSREQIVRLADLAGFSPECWFQSPDSRFGLVLGRARPALRGL
jgi:L-histidine N-alpha-methyltransferase